MIRVRPALTALVAAATAPGRAGQPAALVREGMQKVRGLVRRG